MEIPIVIVLCVVFVTLNLKSLKRFDALMHQKLKPHDSLKEQDICPRCGKLCYVHDGMSGKRRLIDPDTGDGDNFMFGHHTVCRPRPSLALAMARIAWGLTKWTH